MNTPELAEKSRDNLNSERRPKGLKPFNPADFREFAERIDLLDLAVQSCCHWKVLKAPFSHEFVSITTEPLPSVLPIVPSRYQQDQQCGSLLDLLNAEGGISFRLDRGRRSAGAFSRAVDFFGSQQEHTDQVRLMFPGVAPLSSDHEGHVLMSQFKRKPVSATPFSLRVRDVSHYAYWTYRRTKDYNLFQRNCWIHAGYFMQWVTFMKFDHEYHYSPGDDKSSEGILHLPQWIKSRLSSLPANEPYFLLEMIENGNTEALNPWMSLHYMDSLSSYSSLLPGICHKSATWMSELATHTLEQHRRLQHTSNNGNNVPKTSFLEHPDRGILGWLLSELQAGCLVPMSGEDGIRFLDHILPALLGILCFHKKDIQLSSDLIFGLHGILAAVLQMIKVHILDNIPGYFQTGSLSLLYFIYDGGWRTDELADEMESTFLDFILKHAKRDYLETDLLRILAYMFDYERETQLLIRNDLFSLLIPGLQHSRNPRIHTAAHEIFYRCCRQRSGLDYTLGSSAVPYLRKEMQDSVTWRSFSSAFIVGKLCMIDDPTLKGYAHLQLAKSGLLSQAVLACCADELPLHGVELLWAISLPNFPPQILDDPECAKTILQPHVLDALCQVLKRPFASEQDVMRAAIATLILKRLSDLSLNARQLIIEHQAFPGNSVLSEILSGNALSELKEQDYPDSDDEQDFEEDANLESRLSWRKRLWHRKLWMKSRE